MSNKKTRIVIIGGGFGGVKAAQELAKHSECNVTIISDHDQFRYYPTLYHTATGGQRAGSSISLSDLIGDAPIKFVHATVTKLNRDKKEIITEDRKTVPFDKLVLALGSVTNFFGIKGLEKFSYGIKSIEQAEEFKRHLHEQFVKNNCPDLNYVIVGGGPTGIELAGALPGYLKTIMKKHGVADCKLNVELIEAAPRLLPRSPKKISKAVMQRLHSLGVKVMLGQAVEGETSDMLMVGGKPLKSHTVIWTAGVSNNPFYINNGFAINDHGKVVVDEYLRTEPDIYVIGDNAGTPFSGMAQTALRDGEFIANNINRELHGKAPAAYTPKKPITVIPVGPHWATVEWGNRCFNGLIGWALRSLAELKGFSHLEPWTKAGKQWMKTMQEEDMGCPNCMKKKKQ